MDITTQVDANVIMLKKKVKREIILHASNYVHIYKMEMNEQELKADFQMPQSGGGGWREVKSNYRGA